MNAWCNRPELGLCATLLLCSAACHEPTLPAQSSAQPPVQAPATAVPAPAANPPAVHLDAARRGTLIDGIVRELDARYVFPEVATKMRAALQTRAAAGEYDGLSEGPAFART